MPVLSFWVPSVPNDTESYQRLGGFGRNALQTQGMEVIPMQEELKVPLGRPYRTFFI